MSIRGLSALSCCVVLVPALAGGAAVEAARAGEAAPARPPLEMLALSARVAEWGRDAKDPLALIVAAEMRARVTLKTVERRPEQMGEAPDASASATTTDSLLAEAVALSGKDATIAALAEDVKASATKGLVQGANSSRGTIRAAETNWYRKLRFEGMRYAEAVVELAGAGVASISVYDEGGNLVCRDPNPSSVAYCGWHPSSTAYYDVKVENRSNVAAPYFLHTN